MLDLPHYLNDVASEPPCGPDLTYDNDFQAMENAAREKPEQQFGDTVIPAQPPDWRDVDRQATALLGRTKDLRVATLLCRAWTVLHGLPGTARGMQLCAALLEAHWDHLHPLPEDGGDYFMRMNALGTLSDVTGFLRELRNAELLRGAVGPVSVRDAEALARGNPAEDAPSLSADELRMAASRAHAEGHPALLALEPCLQALEGIQASCERHLPSNQMPETAALRQLLQALRVWVPTADTVTEAPLADGTGAASAPTEAGAAQALAAQGGHAVHNREQAIALLLQIADQVERVEPANPAPLFIRRGARFMRMGFMDILRELSPDSLSQVELITGAKAQDGQD